MAASPPNGARVSTPQAGGFSIKWVWGAGRGVWHVARSAPLLSSVHRMLGSPVLNMGTAFSLVLWPLIVTDGMVAFGLTFPSTSGGFKIFFLVLPTAPAVCLLFSV